MVFVSCLLIANLCAFPDPKPVNVIAAPADTYSGLENNWNLFASITFAYTVEGNIVVTTPAVLAVEPIDNADAPIPMNVLSNEYVSSSFVL